MGTIGANDHIQIVINEALDRQTKLRVPINIQQMKQLNLWAIWLNQSGTGKCQQMTPILINHASLTRSHSSELNPVNPRLIDQSSGHLSGHSIHPPSARLIIGLGGNEAF